VKVAGKGNFKAMGAPVLTGTEGWRSYPPTDKFESTDELSYSGVKSFGYTLIAQEVKHASPGAEFSYFDPTGAKYVTLTVKPLPLEASPGSAAAAASAPGSSLTSTSPAVTPPQSSTPAAVSPENPEAPIPGITLHSWKTPAHRTEFVIASILLLLAAATLSVILYLLDLRARGGTPATRRKRRLAGLLASLNEGSLDAASAYESALEYAELAAPPSEKREAVIAGLIQRRDLLKYGVGGLVALTSAEKDQLLESLRDLSKNQPA